MGKQEENSKKRTRKKNIQAVVLGAVAIGGLLVTAAVAPGVLVALGKLDRMGMLPTLRRDESIKRAFARSRKKGLITVHKNRYVLTKEGEYTLAKKGFLKILNPPPRHWDGKWRVLVFDVPQKFERVRGELRYLLVANGFQLLQKSVWVYPYPCDDFVAMIKTKLKIRPFVLYMIVESIENQERLEHEFGLTQ